MLANAWFLSNVNSEETITIPKQKTWEIEGGALYARGSALINGNLPFTPKSDWGYRVDAEYNIDRGKGIHIRWYDLNSAGADLQEEFNQAFSEGPAVARYNYISQLQIADFILSQTVTYQDKLEIEFYGGFEYFNIKFNRDYFLLSTPSQSSITSNAEIKYNGPGPIVGLALDFVMTERVDFYVDAAISAILPLNPHVRQTNSVINRRYTPQKTSGYTTLNEDTGPIGSAKVDMGLQYKVMRIRGELSLKAGWFGVAFHKEDIRWEAYYIGARWGFDV